MNGYHQNVSGGWEEIAQAFSPKLGGWARARGRHEGLEGAFHRKWAEKKLGEGIPYMGDIMGKTDQFMDLYYSYGYEWF